MLKATKELLLSKANLLVVASALTSFVNLIAFLVIPVIFNAEDLAIFVKHNYLGGLFMAIIGSSVTPLAISILNQGYKESLKKYLTIAVGTLLFLSILSKNITFPPFTYFGVIAAVIQTFNGFVMSFFIKREQIYVASVAMLAHPICFLIFLLTNYLYFDVQITWMYGWLGSNILALCIFCFFLNWKNLRDVLSQKSTTNLTWSDMYTKILFAMTFPLFFQIELILSGEFFGLDLSTFVLVQKLYVSIAVSLFSALSAHIIINDLKAGMAKEITIDRKVILMAITSFIATFSVGSIFLYFDVQERFTINIIFMCSCLSLLFTICSYISMRINVINQKLGIYSSILSFLIYIFFIYAFSPSSTESMLIASLFFLSLFLISSRLLSYFVKAP